MIKIYTAIFCCIIICFPAASQKQPIQLKWLNAAQLYLNGGDFVPKSITDFADGSIVSVGYFSNTVDFDPGPDTFNLRAVSATDIFIAKYSAKGALIYAWGFGGQGSDSYESASSVTIDVDDNIYVTGYFSGDVDFDAGTGKTILSASPSAANNFIASYDRKGNLRFAKNITDGSGNQHANSIVLDKNRNIYVAGVFAGTSVDFDPGPNNTATNSRQEDAFFAKYDSTGNFIFVKTFGANDDDYGNKISLDKNGNILFCGSFRSTYVDFDPGPGTHTLQIHGKQDFFFAKYDPLGNYIFAYNIGGLQYDDVSAIVAGPDNSFVITGYFFGLKTDFDPKNPGVHFLSSSGANDAFMARYDENGNYVFAFTIGSNNGDDKGVDITFDADDNIICTGSFSGSKVDFDPGPDTFKIKNTKAGYNYIAKYSLQGGLLSAAAIGSVVDFNVNATISTIKITKTNKLLVAGVYTDSLDADSGTGSTIITSPAPTMFICKYDDDINFTGVLSGNNYRNYPNANSDVSASALDKEGNVYVCGTFSGRYDFDPGPGMYILESFNNFYISQYYSAYFAKYSKAGKLIFAKPIIGGKTNIRDIVIDDDENIYLTGFATEQSDFDPTDSVQYLNDGDVNNTERIYGYFIAKYNKAGKLVFANGDGFDAGIAFNCIALDKDKNIYVAGTFPDSLDLDPGPGKYILHGDANCFVAKYTPVCKIVYAYNFKSDTYSNGSVLDMKFNSKNEFVVTGQFTGKSVDFDPGSQKFLLSSGGNSGYAGFIGTYKANGMLDTVFAVKAEKIYNGVTFYSLAIDTADNVYVAGTSDGKIDFDPSPDTAYLPGSQGMCFASYTSKAGFRFLKGIPEYTSSIQYGNKLSSITTDNDQNIYVAGQFSSLDIDVDPGPDTVLLKNEYYDSYINNINDLFIAKYDKLGNYLYSYDIDGDSAVGKDGGNVSISIMVDNDKNIDYTGFGRTKLNFSTNSKEVYLQPTSLDFNMFVAQYRPTIVHAEIVNKAIAKTDALNYVKVYPNPISDKINIRLNNIEQNSSVAIIGLYDNNGKCLLKTRLGFNNYSLNTTVSVPNNLSHGIYFITIEIEGKTYYSDALIK